jgi:nucleoid DNA-binding protein
MLDLITSYLVQKKECDLPHLGHFRIKTKAVEHDKVNQQIFPQATEILYSEFGGRMPVQLIHYVAAHSRLSDDEAERKIEDCCRDAREKLDSGEAVTFSPLGSLQKDGTGNIFFQAKKQIHLYEPVPAQRVIHKDAHHTMLVGDRETTSAAMNEFYREESAGSLKWWTKWRVWAAILFGICLATLLFYYSVHNFSETGVGNQAPLSAKEPPVLHNTP